MKWFNLPEDRKRLILEQAAASAGISLHAIEKDWWVTIVLRAIFSTSYEKKTSFSKWHIVKQKLAID